MDISNHRRYPSVLLVAAAISGVMLGAGAYTFFYADGFGYLSNDPAVCVNCHVMNGHYDRWSGSSHHAVAVCNDCHIPHGFPGKYIAKMENGLHHSIAFTTGSFHEPIQITPKNRRITESACRHCHGDYVHGVDAFRNTAQEMSCIRCHSKVGHR